MVPEPASRFKIMFASLVVGKRDEDPEDAPALFEAMFNIDENDGELLCEFEADAADLTRIRRRLNCDDEPLGNGRAFVVVGFGTTPIHEAVAALANAYKGTPMGDARYMFEVQEGDSPVPTVLCVQDMKNEHATFCFTAVPGVTHLPVHHEQWRWLAETAHASGLVEYAASDTHDVTVRLATAVVADYFGAISKIVAMFPIRVR